MMTITVSTRKLTVEVPYESEFLSCVVNSTTNTTTTVDLGLVPPTTVNKK